MKALFLVIACLCLVSCARKPDDRDIRIATLQERIRVLEAEAKKCEPTHVYNPQTGKIEPVTAK